MEKILHYDKKIVANNKVDAIDRQRDGEGKGIALEYEKSYEMRKKGGGGGGGVNKKKEKKVILPSR